jgi:hypothetical protein
MNTKKLGKKLRRWFLNLFDAGELNVHDYKATDYTVHYEYFANDKGVWQARFNDNVTGQAVHVHGGQAKTKTAARAAAQKYIRQKMKSYQKGG